MMSEYLQNVFPPSLTGLGNRPSLIPAHQVDCATGITLRHSLILSNRSPTSNPIPSFILPPRKLHDLHYQNSYLRFVAELINITINPDQTLVIVYHAYDKKSRTRAKNVRQIADFIQ